MTLVINPVKGALLDLFDYGVTLFVGGAAAILIHYLIIRLIYHFWGRKPETDQYLKRIADSLK